MKRQFTEEETAEARWAMIKGKSIRDMARAVERVRRALTEDEVLERVSAEEKERYLRGKALLQAGAYLP